MSSASRRSFFCRERARRRTSVASPTGALMAEFGEERLKPLAVAARLQPDDQAAPRAGVERADLVVILMVEFLEVNLTITGIAPGNSLLPCMEVDSARYCHGASFLRSQSRSTASLHDGGGKEAPAS